MRSTTRPLRRMPISGLRESRAFAGATCTNYQAAFGALTVHSGRVTDELVLNSPLGTHFRRRQGWTWRHQDHTWPAAGGRARRGISRSRSERGGGRRLLRHQQPHEQRALVDGLATVVVRRDGERFLIDRIKALTGCQAQKPGARPDSSTLYEGCVAHALDGAYAARQGAMSGLRTPKGCRGSNGRPFNPSAGRPFVRRNAPRGDGGALLQVSARRGLRREPLHA